MIYDLGKLKDTIYIHRHPTSYRFTMFDYDFVLWDDEFDECDIRDRSDGFNPLYKGFTNEKFHTEFGISIKSLYLSLEAKNKINKRTYDSFKYGGILGIRDKVIKIHCDEPFRGLDYIQFPLEELTFNKNQRLV